MQDARPRTRPRRAGVADRDSIDLHDVVVDDSGRRRLILAAMCVALVAVVASVSGLNVAQQALAEDLGARRASCCGSSTATRFAAALLMPIGAIGDRWGRKPVLLIGLVAFAATNVASAFASDPMMLISLRAAPASLQPWSCP
ncbi:MAG: MFS transporter [Acidimicrobiia bacterium]|nr:MFS transporter [Acidimicrobiia bacterium]